MEEIVRFFLTTSNKLVREQLCKNIDKIVTSFVKEKDLKDLLVQV
jgi:hypothetical protein